ncbi:MAG: 30S ribosomal protein S4e [archaeon]|nr:30S ribosomal protein S4e [archaeon]
MSNHMKRLTMPKTWPIPKKTHLWATRQNAGAHSVATSMPATIVLRDMLKVCDTASEAKKIVAARDLIVNGKAVKDAKAPIGLMDVVSIPKMGMNFRVQLTSKGKLAFVAIDEKDARWILCRVENKTLVAGGKMQVNLSGGRNILVDSGDFKTGDSVKVCLETGKIVKSYPLAEGAVVLVISGRHIGAVETIDKYTVVNRPTENIVTFKDGSETVKKNIFVIGTQKSEIAEVSE